MENRNVVRIATRSSPLALWQANSVKHKLEAIGASCELVLIESTGDQQLTQPLYAMGISGIFTKQLDTALLNNQADIAVHSLKDVPTQLAEDLFLAAVLERGSYQDIALVKNESILHKSGTPAVIATSSLRRSAQWLAKYPNHKTVPIRGNVQTRLKKFEEASDIDAVIFAKAGLERLGLLPAYANVLDWMLPAPAQGTIGIVCCKDDKYSVELCRTINHQLTFYCAYAERQFLQTLMGGCSVPISALAECNGNEISIQGAIHSFDGKEVYRVTLQLEISQWTKAGQLAAEKLLEQNGAQALLQLIRNNKPYHESAGDKSA